MPIVGGEKVVQAKCEEQGHNPKPKDEASAFQLRLELVHHMHRIKLKMLMAVDPLQSRTLEVKVETAVKPKLGASDVAETLLLIPLEVGDNPVVDNPVVDSRLSTVVLGVVASTEDVTPLVA
jgi:hypothetical protein